MKKTIYVDEDKNYPYNMFNTPVGWRKVIANIRKHRQILKLTANLREAIKEVRTLKKRN